PIGNGAQLPRSRRAATHRIALAKLTPNRFAAARQLMPSSRTAETTRLRKSTDNGPIPRRLRFGALQESDFQALENTRRFNPAGNRSKHDAERPHRVSGVAPAFQSPSTR